MQQSVKRLGKEGELKPSHSSVYTTISIHGREEGGRGGGGGGGGEAGTQLAGD